MLLELSLLSTLRFFNASELNTLLELAHLTVEFVSKSDWIDFRRFPRTDLTSSCAVSILFWWFSLPFGWDSIWDFGSDEAFSDETSSDVEQLLFTIFVVGSVRAVNGFVFSNSGSLFSSLSGIFVKAAQSCRRTKGTWFESKILKKCVI